MTGPVRFDDPETTPVDPDDADAGRRSSFSFLNETGVAIYDLNIDVTGHGHRPSLEDVIVRRIEGDGTQGDQLEEAHDVESTHLKLEWDEAVTTDPTGQAPGEPFEVEITFDSDFGDDDAITIEPTSKSGASIVGQSTQVAGAVSSGFRIPADIPVLDRLRPRLRRYTGEAV